MNKEIKEMLEDFKEHLNKCEENFKKGAVDSTVYEIYCDDLRLLLDYITNLQEELEKYKRYADETFLYTYEELQDKVINLQEESRQLKERVQIGQNAFLSLNSKIDKAIEYIKNDWYELNTRDIEHCINLNKDIRIDLLNILQGEDKQ